MEILIEPHTLERAVERGTNAFEVRDVIITGFSIPARYGRIRKGKIYNFQQYWRNRYYEQKRVEVIYTVEDDTIVTVTVYVFYGNWEHEDGDYIQF
jgi:Domain of unknown function (DUF4258)